MSMNAWIAVRDYSIHKGSRLVLLWMIADSIMDDSNSCYCSLATLADRSRLFRSEVQRYLPDLIATGDLIRVKRKGHTDTYFIPILENEPGYAPEQCESKAHQCNGYHTPLEVLRADLGAPRKRARRGYTKAYNESEGPTGVGGGGPQEWAGSDDEHGEAHRSGRGRPTGVGGGGPQEWAGEAHRSGPKHLLNTSSNTSFKNAPAREPIILGNLAEQRTEPEQDPTPPAPPPQPAPDTPEKRNLWRDITYLLPHYGVSQPQVDAMRGAHLYEPFPGVFQLQVPRGQDRQKFRDRYEQPIRRAVETLVKQGNQVVNFI